MRPEVFQQITVETNCGTVDHHNAVAGQQPAYFRAGTGANGFHQRGYAQTKRPTDRAVYQKLSQVLFEHELHTLAVS